MRVHRKALSESSYLGMMKACSEFSIRKASFVSNPLESGFRPFSASMKNSELLVLGNRMGNRSQQDVSEKVKLLLRLSETTPSERPLSGVRVRANKGNKCGHERTKKPTAVCLCSHSSLIKCRNSG